MFCSAGGGHLKLDFLKKQVSTFCLFVCLLMMLKCIAHLNVTFYFLTGAVLLGGALLDMQGVSQ